MAEFKWFRSWHGAPKDDKWPVIAMRANVKTGIVSAIAWALMDYASQQEDRGSVKDFDTEAYAVYSGIPEEDIIAVIKAMAEIKYPVIADGRLTNWEKRQPKREDDSRDRVTKFRELQRSVTQSNAEGEEVTFYSTSLSPSVLIKGEDNFSIFQRFLETHGILLTSEGDIKTLTEIIATGATVEDLETGLVWRMQHNKGKPVRYVGQLVGPTETARLTRLQKNNGKPEPPDKPKSEWVTDPKTGGMYL